MTITLECEVEEREIINELVHNTELIEQAVSELRSRAKPATAEHALWTAVSQALGIANEDLDRMAPGAWAEAYRLMDRIDRTTAMDELRRLCPEDFP
jgi:hypothetical protein